MLCFVNKTPPIVRRNFVLLCKMTEFLQQDLFRKTKPSAIIMNGGGFLRGFSILYTISVSNSVWIHTTTITFISWSCGETIAFATSSTAICYINFISGIICRWYITCICLWANTSTVLVTIIWNTFRIRYARIFTINTITARAGRIT